MPDARRATPLTKPRMGLLAAAAVTESQTAGTGRWGWGLEWRPELTDEASGAFGARELECITSSIPIPAQPTNEIAEGFMVYAVDTCGTMDDADLADPRDRRGRAERLLMATRSASVAKEFWSGAISATYATANTWLKKAGSTDVGGASASPAKQLADLDQAIATNLSNGRGMIHCRVVVLDRLAQDMAIRREGNLWLTPFDNIVVADAGYDGTGPAAGEWMFATTMVEIYFGPVQMFDSPVATHVRTINDMHVWAQQDVIVLHEPHLLWHRAQVDLS